MTPVFVNIFAFFCIVIAFFKNKEKTLKGLKKAIEVFFRMLPMVLGIVVVMGFLMAFIPKDFIASSIGEESGLSEILLPAVLGAILHIPSIISFPLAGGLIDKGASTTSVAIFITTLTMIGIVTLPLEVKEIGKKIAFLRNGISFLIAIIIGLIMGAIL